MGASPRDLGYGEHLIPNHRYSVLDDHTPFITWGLPAALMIDLDYPYWHTTRDTLDKISADSLQRVGRCIGDYVGREASGQKRGRGHGHQSYP